MAVNSTSSSTGLAGSSGTLGGGTVIDVNAIVTKLDAVEQAPIDKLNAKIASQDLSISDLGTIKSKMSAFQAALQDFADPLTYLNKSVTSSNTNAVTPTVSDSLNAAAGNYQVTVTSIASAYTATYLANSFDFARKNTITLKASDGVEQKIDLGEKTSSLTALRDAINANSADSKIRAAIVNTGSGSALTLTSITGGEYFGDPVEKKKLGILLTSESTDTIKPNSEQLGSDASFTVNGQQFTRTNNTVTEAIPGITLQLQAEGSSTITVTSANAASAQTLITNVGQAYNDLMAVYSDLSKYNSDPAKRGSLYGDATLQSMMDSIALSFTEPLKSSGNTLYFPKTTKPISFVSLGLEMQLDGTLKFNTSIYDAAVTAGAFDLVSQGTTGKTKTSVDSAMLYGGGIDADVTAATNQKAILANRVKDLQTRKDEKMAKYRAQYAALDALLFQLQSTNNSLSATFNALNNQKNN